MKLSRINSFLFIAVFSLFISGYFQLNLYGAAGVFGGMLLLSQFAIPQNVLSATTITATQVIADFGAYYIDNGQTEEDIHTALQETFESQELFTVIESEDTRLQRVNAAFGEVLQSFQTTFTPKGEINFDTVSIDLFNVKVDEAFYPDAIKYSWLQFMTSNNLDRTTWPFVRWVIEKYLYNQIKLDLEKTIYPAVYVAPTAGIPNAASESYNGLKKIINDAITATDIVVIPTGTPNADPVLWVGQIETFVASIPELYWSQGMTIVMSRALALRYRQGRRKKYNMNYAQENDLTIVEDFENVKIAGYASMAGTNKIWATPKMNIILGYRGTEANMTNVEVEKVDRLVKIYTDFFIGLGFLDNSIVFTNDQDLT